ncbi:MAG: DUF4190 domain-containing protein [Candidatus Microsaccharimonas sp.]
MNPSQPAHTPTPGKTLAIVGFILGFVGTSLIGLPFSIAAAVKSSKAGKTNGLAIAGIVTNSVFLILGLFIIPIIIVSYNGITARANTNSALSSANTVLKYAEVYNADNGSYPMAYSYLTEENVTLKNITLQSAYLKSAPTEPETINFYSCSGNGVKVGYWDYQNERMVTLSAGDTSGDCVLSTK